MIFAAPILGRMGVETDAHGCRQFSEGIRMLAGRRAAGSLPHVAVLALGANGPVGPGQIASALRVIGRRRVLGLVTARRSPVTDARMHAAARSHPDRVVLIDWVSFSAGHGGWFAGDGLHVDEQGAAAYARLIHRTIAPFAFPPVRALRMPRHSTGRRGCGVVHQFGRRLRVFVVRGTHRIVCVRARALVRRPPLRVAGGWTAYDWRRTGDGPWAWVYRRHDGRVVVAAVEAKRR